MSNTNSNTDVSSTGFDGAHNYNEDASAVDEAQTLRNSAAYREQGTNHHHPRRSSTGGISRHNNLTLSSVSSASDKNRRPNNTTNNTTTGSAAFIIPHENVTSFSNTSMNEDSYYDDGDNNEDSPNSTGTPPESSKAIKKRTKTGCLSCRRRKVKCDEAKPSCQRCQNARIECAGYPALPEPKAPKKQRNSNKPPSAVSSRRSSTAVSSSLSSSASGSANGSFNSGGGASMNDTGGSRAASPPLMMGPVRKAPRLSTMNEDGSMDMSSMNINSHSPVSSTFANAAVSPSSTGPGPARKSRPASILVKRKSMSNASLSSMNTSASAPVFSSSYSTGHSPVSPRSSETIATAPTLSRINSTSAFASSVTGSGIHTPSIEHSSNSSSAFERDFNSGSYHRYNNVDSRYRPSSQLQMAFSPTLAPPLQTTQAQAYASMQNNSNTFAPFAFDSPYSMQPFVTASPLSMSLGTPNFNNPNSSHNSSNNLAINNNNLSMGNPNTPIDFDSLFGYTSNNMQQSAQSQIQNERNGDGVGAPYPVEFWEDADFVDRVMTGFKDVHANQQMNPEPTDQAGHITEPAHSTGAGHATSNSRFSQINSAVPSLSSSSTSIMSNTARTPSACSPTYNTSAAQEEHTYSNHSNSGSVDDSPRSAHSDTRHKSRPASRCSQVSIPTTVSTSAAPPVAPPAPANTTMADFAPQPAIDPILQATSTSELHKAAANRNKTAPSLRELEMGPPPNLHGNQKEWSIPSGMNETMKGMTNARHVELLKHYFINLVGLFSPIDHPKNPFRTFVAEHATQSLSLLHAVLAVSAINQQPLSVEARAESLLYFEAAVDLYVRSLQQQDDISLFTLLFLSLYYAFDSGTAQPQHFSRKAQSIINERFELMGHGVMQASSDFRFLVRFHVWYEVMANISRRAGDLRDMACGQYTLTYLISVIERWDAQEEKAAGLSGVNPDYIMNGCVGVPTFFISLLNDIMRLKEEQHHIKQISLENLDEANQAIRRAVISKHSRKIRDLECKIQFARPGRMLLPPVVANELPLHRAVSVRFFDLFRLAASIHLLTELQSTPVDDPAIQLRTTEMVNLLGNIEQNSNYNTSGIWAFFIAGAAASNHMDRIALHRRLDSTWNSPCGNVWSLRSILDEVWQRNAEALENNEPCQTWKEIAQQRGWQLLLM